MPYRIALGSGIHKSIASVMGAHFAAVTITFTDIEWFFKIGGLAVAMGYGIWRWRVEYKKEKRRELAVKEDEAEQERLKKLNK